MHRWEPTPFPEPGYYWPPGAESSDTPGALKSAFKIIGYEECDSGNYEPDYEKIALYVDDEGIWSHAAKLEPNGEWSSKLGVLEDISHSGTDVFDDSCYGTVFCFMKRRL